MNVRTINYKDSNNSREFTRSLRQTGFGVLNNHPIDFNLIYDVYNEWEKFFNGKEVNITPTFTNADTRIRNQSKRRKLTKYNIELPMPQEIQDSQSINWGDDRINAIQLAGVSAAGRSVSYTHLRAHETREDRVCRGML